MEALRSFDRRDLWSALGKDAVGLMADAPLAGLAWEAVLQHGTFAAALSHQLACKLGGGDVGALHLRGAIREAHAADPSMVESAQYDLLAAVERDPACRRLVTPFLFHKGFLALQAHRVAHCLWRQGREHLAGSLQSRTSQCFHVDIHPAARVGRGVFIDHGTGIVVGETAVIGDEVSMLQDVTVGGAGDGARHPRIGKGAQLFAGAQVLGDVQIGDHAKIAAGSLVMRDVPAGCTAVGVPARLVNCRGELTGPEPARRRSACGRLDLRRLRA